MLCLLTLYKFILLYFCMYFIYKILVGENTCKIVLKLYYTSVIISSSCVPFARCPLRLPLPTSPLAVPFPQSSYRRLPLSVGTSRCYTPSTGGSTLQSTLHNPVTKVDVCLESCHHFWQRLWSRLFAIPSIIIV